MLQIYIMSDNVMLLQLMSCSGAAPDGDACDGGFPNQALAWVISNKGQTTETNYPFQEAMTTCAKEPSAQTINKVVALPGSTMDVLKVPGQGLYTTSLSARGLLSVMCM